MQNDSVHFPIEKTRRRVAGIVKFALAIALLPLSTPALAQADIPNSADHPMVGRYPGAVITDYTVANFDEFTVPLGKTDSSHMPAKSEKIEGKVTRIVYKTPAPRTTLEIYKNFEDALNRGGFKILYSCTNDACGNAGPTELGSVGTEDWNWGKGQRFLAAKVAGPAGTVYVTLHFGQWSAANAGTETVLFVAETKAMEGGLVKVDAGAIGDDLAAQGHVAIYGIFFDTGKAELKPESEAELKEIAQVLKSQPDLKLLVVGHTDNVGPFAANMELSRSRAEAVVKALATRYAIAPGRLSAQGAGALAPVASNRAEAGRAKNRRVELVEQ